MSDPLYDNVPANLTGIGWFDTLTSPIQVLIEGPAVTGNYLFGSGGGNPVGGQVGITSMNVQAVQQTWQKTAPINQALNPMRK